jgi:energy-coupling factor transporter ATP-binding protein EcfA2
VDVAEKLAIDLKDVSFRYASRKQPTLKNINFSAERGEMVMVMGHGGAGKSTLCRLLTALIPHRIQGRLSGTARIFGVNIKDTSPVKLAHKVGLVFQDFESQLFSTNVELEVAFGPQNLSLDQDEIRTRVHEALSSVGLLGFESRQPAGLSGGEKQRLAIASVLSLRPELLCLDEPTSDLDPVGKARIISIARDFSLKEDRTLIAVDHDSNSALSADRIVLMRDGEIVADGSPRQVLAEPDQVSACGVMPPQIPHLFHNLGWEMDNLPFTLEEGLEAFKKSGWSISPIVKTELDDKDTALQAGYGEKIIEVRDLVFDYNGHQALRGISLDIRKGEFVAIVGQNGSGKTTLVKHFNGLLTPSSGSVTIFGNSSETTSVVELSKRVGYVFQNPDHQIFNDTVEQEVSFSLRLRGMTEVDISDRTRETLDVVGLSGRGDEDPFTMTKGERQRVAVASVLAARPDVIIMDEPTTGLDYLEQLRMMELLKKLNQAGHTIIAITHTMWVVAEYAQRVIVVVDGTILEDDSVRKVFGESESKLISVGLIPAPITRLSTQLGYTFLSVKEFVQAVEMNQE